MRTARAVVGRAHGTAYRHDGAKCHAFPGTGYMSPRRTLYQLVCNRFCSARPYKGEELRSSIRVYFLFREFTYPAGILEHYTGRKQQC